ncbi:MAG: PHB depolymerase family esterase, partial [Dokdonella sp.]
SSVTERAEEDVREDPGAGFHEHVFTCDAGTLHYKLFVPAGLGAAAPPFILMLHGCTQSPDDFARGTRMNELAQKNGYVVAYPAQASSNNAGKCWNWFRSGDQQRGRGEPALLAALTRHLIVARSLDANRVFVAGLSAGGAMAVVLGTTYPDIFAAIGVHSGLPYGAAHDLPSALAAMKQGARRSGANPAAAYARPIPAIVFHGDRDTTVDACNGEAVVAQCMGEKDFHGDKNMRSTVEQASMPGGRSYARTTFVDPDGGTAAEYWVVHGAGHAWFGGSASGSYTDPSGPDASEHMIRFFSTVRRRSHSDS